MSFTDCKILSSGKNSDHYHAGKGVRGDPLYTMSPSSIKAFMGCPARWIAGYQPPDSKAKTYGNLLDTRLLTPESFEARFSVKPATYPDAKTKEPKSWNGNATFCREWDESQGERSIISANDLAECDAAIKRLLCDETISDYLKCCAKQVHVGGSWTDEKTGLKIPVECLIDLVPGIQSEWRKTIGDLKTTRNAALGPFSRWCFTAGYHIQAAFDLDIYCAATGEDRTDWIFILQENFSPYQTGRRLLSQDLLQIGRQTYKAALARYARCLKTGEWSGYDPAEEFSLINAEPWMEFTAISEAMENEQAEQLDTEDVPS